MRIPGTRRLGEWISCKDASRLISRNIDNPLPFRSVLRLRLHLMWCKACQRFEQQTEALHAILQKYRR